MKKTEIGQIVQNRRYSLSLNQSDLAEMTGITTKTIYMIENGKGNPSLDTLKKILEVLGLDLFIDTKKIAE